MQGTRRCSETLRIKLGDNSQRLARPELGAQLVAQGVELGVEASLSLGCKRIDPSNTKP